MNLKSAAEPSRPESRCWQILCNPALLFAVAFLVRVAFFVHLFRITTIERFWNTGFEACHIAASLASGNGFSSPFGIATGPSAWVPPAYAGVLALLFKLFRPYSTAALWCALLLNAAVASATAVLIFLAGTRIGGIEVGATAGWVWALSSYAITMSVKVWETSLSAFLVMAGTLLYWKLCDSENLRDWVYWGLFWGIAVLVNPALGIFFLVLSAGAVWNNSAQRQCKLGLAAVVALAAIAPWTARNYVQFRALIPIRSNFGEELWLGNHEGVSRPNDETLQPLGSRLELALYRDLGERAFLAQKQAAALDFIRDHPKEFLQLTVRRMTFFWSTPDGRLWIPISILSFLGLGFAMRHFRQGLPFAVGLLLYPSIYYVTHADNWYRHPIEPLMTVLFVYAFFNVFRKLREPNPRILAATRA